MPQEHSPQIKELLRKASESLAKERAAREQLSDQATTGATADTTAPGSRVALLPDDNRG
jgi:hypothetical protein